MVGVRTERLELDELWSFVGKKNVKPHEIDAKGDQYIFVNMAGKQKAIISWAVGKRNTESTMDFLRDLGAELSALNAGKQSKRRAMCSNNTVYTEFGNFSLVGTGEPEPGRTARR